MEGLTVTEIEMLKQYSVDWSDHSKKWMFQFEFIIKGCSVKYRSPYFESFDEAATVAKAKAVQVVREFNK